MTDEFYKFCTAHCCREECRDRSDYCPIADIVRKQLGYIAGDCVCQDVFYKQKTERAMLCSGKECEPPFGGKEDCEFNQSGVCVANDLESLRSHDSYLEHNSVMKAQRKTLGAEERDKMTDKEIIKALRHYAYRYRQPPYGREIEGTDRLLEDAADRLEELVVTMENAMRELEKAIKMLEDLPKEGTL